MDCTQQGKIDLINVSNKYSKHRITQKSENIVCVTDRNYSKTVPELKKNKRKKERKLKDPIQQWLTKQPRHQCFNDVIWYHLVISTVIQ